jgi:hypothetical protein
MVIAMARKFELMDNNFQKYSQEFFLLIQIDVVLPISSSTFPKSYIRQIVINFLVI